MDIDTFYTKRLEAQVEDAKELTRKYYERFVKKSEEEIFHKYFMLFSKEQVVLNNIVFDKKLTLVIIEDNLLNMLKNVLKFRCYDEFRRYCFDEK